MRWEHACTYVNIPATENIRWLPRTRAADLFLPGADCFVFDHRLIRWNFQNGDGTNPGHYTFSSNPAPCATSPPPSRSPGTTRYPTPCTRLTNQKVWVPELLPECRSYQVLPRHPVEVATMTQ
jgi:hypothetical protein